LAKKETSITVPVFDIKNAKLLSVVTTEKDKANNKNKMPDHDLRNKAEYMLTSDMNSKSLI